MPPSPIFESGELKVYDVGHGCLLFELDAHPITDEELRWGHVEMLRDALTCWLDNP